MLRSTRLQKPQVWFVDDRRENREKFRAHHEEEFEIEVFSEPDDVLRAIREGRRPDALLCDIYFYKDENQREAVEKLVEQKISELQRQAAEFHHEQAQEGIALMAKLGDEFSGKPPFPIFAYTSKGTYLFDNEAFNRIADLGARWLFKNKYSVQNERREIRQAIGEFTESRYRDSRAWDVTWRTGLVAAVAGAILGAALVRTARHFGW